MRFLFAAAAAWVIVWAAPVRLCVRADVGAQPSYAVEVSVYGLCARFAGRIRVRRGAKKRRGFFKRAAARFALEMLRLPGTRAGAAARLGTGDAALTALCAGTLQAILGAANAAFPMRVRVTADFRHAGFCLSARCIVTARGGDIIRTGVRAVRLARRARGGEAKWRSIPLKP